MFVKISTLLVLAAGLSSVAEAGLPYNVRAIGRRNFDQNRNQGNNNKNGFGGFGNSKGGSSSKASDQGKNANGGKAATTAATTTTTTAAAAAATTAASSSSSSSGSGAGSADSSVLQLNPANVQSGSDQTGQNGTDAEAGQVNSATDPANFINFCTGKTLTNGLQVKTGSCNGVVMGNIPSTDNMISTVITFPAPGQDLEANTDFNITLFVQGLTAGQFTNAAATYYSAPQDLDGSGKILGHSHVTVQDLGGTLSPSNAPDPVTFAFFKGIDDAGDGQGHLSATVTGGLPAGFYRVCSMNSAANHQPVLMPVAQRGGQDDCQKFTVGQGSGAASSGADNTGSSASSTTTTAAAVAAASTTTSAAASAKTTAAAANNSGKEVDNNKGSSSNKNGSSKNNNKNQFKQPQRGRGRGRGRKDRM